MIAVYMTVSYQKKKKDGRPKRGDQIRIPLLTANVFLTHTLKKKICSENKIIFC